MTSTCARCGTAFTFEHAFCGNCGTPRAEAPVASSAPPPYGAYPAPVRSAAGGSSLGVAAFLLAGLLGLLAVGGTALVHTTDPEPLYEFGYLSTLLWTFPYLLAIFAVVATRVPSAGSVIAAGSVLAYFIADDRFDSIGEGGWQFLIYLPTLIVVELVVLAMLRRNRAAGAVLGGLLGGAGIVLSDTALFALTEGYLDQWIREWSYVGPSVLFPLGLALAVAVLGWLLSLVGTTRVDRVSSKLRPWPRPGVGRSPGAPSRR